MDYTYLQQRYGGRYIARRAGEVLASAATYEDLSNLVDALAEDGEDLIIEYVEPVESVRVYGVPFTGEADPVCRVSDPTIPVTIQTQVGVRTYMFLVDTGADCAVAPRRLAQQLGLIWTSLPPAQVVGIGHGGVSTRVGPLTFQVGPWTFTVRCMFVDAPRAP